MPDDVLHSGRQEAGEEFRLSAAAAARVATLIKAEGTETFLRVSVSGGGCAGFQYAFTLDSERHADDREFVCDRAVVRVDETSLELVRGAELHFVEDLSGAYFQMRNPNAASSCGCGMSFAIG